MMSKLALKMSEIQSLWECGYREMRFNGQTLSTSLGLGWVVCPTVTFVHPTNSYFDICLFEGREYAQAM